MRVIVCKEGKKQMKMHKEKDMREEKREEGEVHATASSSQVALKPSCLLWELRTFIKH